MSQPFFVRVPVKTIVEICIEADTETEAIQSAIHRLNDPEADRSEWDVVGKWTAIGSARIQPLHDEQETL